MLSKKDIKMIKMAVFVWYCMGEGDDDHLRWENQIRHKVFLSYILYDVKTYLSFFCILVGQDSAWPRTGKAQVSRDPIKLFFFLHKTNIDDS
jgi:hypothetical protein